jgi:septal ring-binding cell division protein DamX
MKKIVLLIVVLVGIWLGVNYMRTGQFSLMPSTMSAEEQHVRDLENQIADIDQQMAQAGRTAGMTGMDTTQDVSALMVKKEKLQKELEEARKKLLH